MTDLRVGVGRTDRRKSCEPEPRQPRKILRRECMFFLNLGVGLIWINIFACPDVYQQVSVRALGQIHPGLKHVVPPLQQAGFATR